MIANLITTILVALGVATGNVSSNTYKGGNAFNHEKIIEQHDEKPRQNARETKTLNYTKVNEYNNNYPNRVYTNQKYYLENQVSVDTVIANIYSTSYLTNYYADDTRWAASMFFNIYEINPYINATDTETIVRWGFYHDNYGNYNYNINVERKAFITTNNIYSQYIDLTVYSVLEDSTLHYNETDLSDFVHRVDINQETNLTQIYNDTRTYNNIPPNSRNYYTTDVNIGSLTQKTTLIIQTYVNVINPQNIVRTKMNLDSFTIEGDVVPINYEVVDIPNLMFTILTMPFAFYSTAFNLTIFPNTPYALNFGNLVLTILAALILLYLIRKIIK